MRNTTTPTPATASLPAALSSYQSSTSVSVSASASGGTGAGTATPSAGHEGPPESAGRRRRRDDSFGSELDRDLPPTKRRRTDTEHSPHSRDGGDDVCPEQPLERQAVSAVDPPADAPPSHAGQDGDAVVAGAAASGLPTTEAPLPEDSPVVPTALQADPAGQPPASRRRGAGLLPLVLVVGGAGLGAVLLRRWAAVRPGLNAAHPLSRDFAAALQEGHRALCAGTTESAFPLPVAGTGASGAAMRSRVGRLLDQMARGSDRDAAAAVSLALGHSHALGTAATLASVLLVVANASHWAPTAGLAALASALLARRLPPDSQPRARRWWLLLAVLVAVALLAPPLAVLYAPSGPERDARCGPLPWAAGPSDLAPLAQMARSLVLDHRSLQLHQLNVQTDRCRVAVQSSPYGAWAAAQGLVAGQRGEAAPHSPASEQCHRSHIAVVQLALLAGRVNQDRLAEAVEAVLQPETMWRAVSWFFALAAGEAVLSGAWSTPCLALGGALTTLLALEQIHTNALAWRRDTASLVGDPARLLASAIQLPASLRVLAGSSVLALLKPGIKLLWRLCSGATRADDDDRPQDRAS